MIETRGSFNDVDYIVSFFCNMKNHMGNKNYDRVKDYLCEAFTVFNPENAEYHPCLDIINRAIEMLSDNGWLCAITNWKQLGKQFVAVSPTKEYYHSNYKY